MAGVRSKFYWNGRDLPEELHDLPPGTYLLEAIDQPPMLTDDEDAGLSAALASLRAGKGRTLEQVQQTIAAILRR
ncbi:MAG TPA: hypothetical protein VHW23_04265 [Kofleriaceae bacterium]|jgi:hypothetical protein|nr:hypothetical protein [Kofleriaceae bacterium]